MSVLSSLRRERLSERYLVIGGPSGIGAALVTELAQAGLEVLQTTRTPERAAVLSGGRQHHKLLLVVAPAVGDAGSLRQRLNHTAERVGEG